MSTVSPPALPIVNPVSGPSRTGEANTDLPQVAPGGARWIVATPIGDASFPTYDAAESFVNTHGGTVVGHFHAMDDGSEFA